MRTVHKFPLDVIDGDQRHYRIDRTARIVHVGEQNGLPTIWAEVDRDGMAYHPTVFRVFGTGHDIPDEYEHVGTCMIGLFVWHIYRRKE